MYYMAPFFTIIGIVFISLFNGSLPLSLVSKPTASILSPRASSTPETKTRETSAELYQAISNANGIDSFMGCFSQFESMAEGPTRSFIWPTSQHGLLLYLLLARTSFASNKITFIIPSLLAIHMMMKATNALTITRINALDASAGDYFGNGVSFDGNRAIVAAQGVSEQRGAAYIFEFVDTAWVQTAKLTPNDYTATALHIGYFSGVDIFGDVAIIGAHGVKYQGVQTGSAYVFEYNGISWVQTAELTAADAGLTRTDYLYFGYAVAIWDDTILVGNFGGLCLMYAYNGGSWQFKQQLEPWDASTSSFGMVVAINQHLAVVGDSSAAYIYRYDGTDWVDDAKISSGSPNFAGCNCGAGGGKKVSISPSGDAIIVGDPMYASQTGGAWIYEYNGASWVQNNLVASDTNAGYWFGSSVSIFNDFALVGSTPHNAAYLFEKTHANTWSESERWIEPTLSAFGSSVFLYQDIAFIGAQVDNAVYIYDMTPTSDPTVAPTRHPTEYPTRDPTEDPTADPTTDPTKDPTTDPTADPTTEPTTEPTMEPTEDPTADPTDDPTIDPTADPTHDPTVDPTVDPTQDPTIDPTIDPTADPTNDPTVDPTKDPTHDPTKDPTVDPTKDPTQDPTNDPTVDPTRDPTVDPTTDPTKDPTTHPTADPTAAPTGGPTTAPTVSPSTAPHSLKMEIELSLESEESNMNDIYIYIILFGVPALIIIFVFIMKSTVLKDKLLAIDRVQYVSVALYFLQVFDLYSDAMFTLQLYSYYAWAKHTDYEITSSEINEFYFLFLFSLGFTILPYCANFVSSGRIVAMITSDPIISIYSKEWFKYNSGNYSIGVLLSGGSYFTLKVINSNFLGLPQLSAGLSAKQIERFAAHKVLYNTLLENFPQMIIQFYFLWGLGLVTSIVVISLILSLFNILLSVLSTWMRRSSFAFQKEFPFAINLSIVENADGNANANPYRNAGRIERLSEVLKALARENLHHFSFEIMTFSRIEKSLYGVVIYKDAEVEDIKAFLDNNIEKAVLTAFECDEYAFSVRCIYPMDAYNRSNDAETATNTKKADYKGGSHVIEVEMKQVQSSEDDEGEGEAQGMDGTDFNQSIRAKSGSESEDEIALPEAKATTGGEMESLSVEQILLHSWNLDQYWNTMKELGYDDHKYWKKLIKNADVLAQIFGATKGHKERFVDYVQQMK